MKGAATVYGLSTSGYRIASALVSKGVSTTIIDENLQMGLQLKAETVKMYPTLEALTDEEALLGLQPMDAAIGGANHVFFTPRIRRMGDDLKGELSMRMREVSKHLSKGATLIYNLPTSIGGNADNLELLRRVSGLKPDEDFRYIYAPLDPNTDTPTVIGFRRSRLEKEDVETMTLIGMKASSLASLESAELLHFKYVMGRYIDQVAALESYRRIEDRDMRLRFKKIPGYREVYLNELVENMLDLRLLVATLTTGEPLLHMATGLIRSVEGFTRYLVEETKDVMKSKELKASKTKVALVWSLDRFEMRGDRLQVSENLTDRLRDYVGEILRLNSGDREKSAQRTGWQNIFLGGKTSLLIACSNKDFESASDTLSSNRSPTDAFLIKANLLCEVVQ